MNMNPHPVITDKEILINEKAIVREEAMSGQVCDEQRYKRAVNWSHKSIKINLIRMSKATLN